MRMIQKLTAVAASAAMFLSATAPTAQQFIEALPVSAATTINNPFIWSDVPDDDIIRVGDTYYMVSTTMFFSPGAPIMKSTDLYSWEICSYVYDIYADGDVQNLSNGKHDYAHGQWATSLRYHNGYFYVFFGSYGSGKSYIYKTKDIESGDWTRSELNGMYHDASLLFDDDGRNYLVYGGGGEIKIKEFNAEMTDFKWGGVDKTLFKTGLDGLAGEGSHIQKIGDYYYVFVIAWPSGKGRIELCYRSKELTGLYEGKIVLDNALSGGGGVAQGGIVDTPDGKWYGLLFQDHGSIGRVPVLVPVTWEDNWPMMGVNGKVPETLTIDGEYYGTLLAKDDDFSYDTNELKLEWQWNHNPDNKAWSVTEREGYLRLKNEHIATNILNARNTLTMRTEGPACSSVVKLDTKNMKVGDYAGLSAFQLNYGNVGVYVADDGSKRIYMAKNGGNEIANSSNKIIQETGLNGDEIYLKVDFKFSNTNQNGVPTQTVDKANFFYSYNGNDWTKIGEELSMTYDLKLFTGYRSGLYSYPTKTTGGFADFDFFDYERADWNTPTAELVVTPVEPDENGWFYHDTFEGSTNDWTGRGAASVSTSGRTAYDGQEALLVQDRTAAWNGATKKLNKKAFVPGETFSFSANVMYLEGTPSQNFFMKLQYVDAEGETNYSTIAETTAVRGEWVQLANTEYTIPADAKDMYIYIETTDDDELFSNFYVDEAIGAVSGTVIAGAGEAISAVKGDVTCDGIVDAFDLAAMKYGLIIEFQNPRAALAADTNSDGNASVADLVLLQSFLLGRISAFPTETES